MTPRRLETKFELTSDRRYEVCIHEAAHAVIYAYGGTFVYSVEVAPLGISDLSLTGRKGHMYKETMGLCSTSDAPFSYCLLWNIDDCTFVADKKTFRSVMKSCVGWRKRNEIKRRIRAHVCGCLAGPVADAKYRGKTSDEIYLESESVFSGTPDDVSIAEALSWFLPSWKEFDLLTKETDRLLRMPEIWERVLKLADVLNHAGKIEEDIPFLPEPCELWPVQQYGKRFA